MSKDEGNGLTRSDFRHGYTLFGVHLNLDACDGSCSHLIQMVIMRIEIHFDGEFALTVYSEFEAVLDINMVRKGKVIYDY